MDNIVLKHVLKQTHKRSHIWQQLLFDVMGNNPVSVILCSPYRARIPDDILKCIINMCVCVMFSDFNNYSSSLYYDSAFGISR